MPARPDNSQLTTPSRLSRGRSTVSFRGATPDLVPSHPPNSAVRTIIIQNRLRYCQLQKQSFQWKKLHNDARKNHSNRKLKRKRLKNLITWKTVWCWRRGIIQTNRTHNPNKQHTHTQHPQPCKTAHRWSMTRESASEQILLILQDIDTGTTTTTNTVKAALRVVSS